MKKIKKVCIYIISVLLVVIFISRVIYINKKYPVAEKVEYSLNENIKHKGLSINIVSKEIIDDKEFFEKYGSEELIKWYEAKNENEESKLCVIKININNSEGSNYDNYLNSAHIYSNGFSNGVNTWLCRALNNGQRINSTCSEYKYIFSIPQSLMSSDKWKKVYNLKYSLILSDMSEVTKIDLW